MDNRVSLLLFKVSKFTITEYTENPRTDDGFIEYSLLSNFIHLDSSLEPWKAIANATMK